jgi:copper(I)-binding protein
MRKTAQRNRNLHSLAGKHAHYAPRLIGYAILAAALLLVAIGVATAHEYGNQGVTVAQPWARATPGGAKVGGAYLEIKTAAGRRDRLVGARSPAAGAVEIHSHVNEGGIARMRRVDAIALKPGASFVLQPGGHHLMLTDLKAPLKEGDLVKLTLVFEKAGEIEVEATVAPIGATGPRGLDRQPGTAVKKSPAKAKTSGEHKH